MSKFLYVIVTYFFTFFGIYEKVEEEKEFLDLTVVHSDLSGEDAEKINRIRIVRYSRLPVDKKLSYELSHMFRLELMEYCAE